MKKKLTRVFRQHNLIINDCEIRNLCRVETFFQAFFYNRETAKIIIIIIIIIIKTKLNDVQAMLCFCNQKEGLDMLFPAIWRPKFEK